MPAPIPLIALSALPVGRGLRVCRDGLDLAVFRVGDSAYAVDDSCPHAGASLANGRLSGTRVRCPVHGLTFELDPACPPGPPMLQARKHAVRVIDGVVMLELPDAVQDVGADVERQLR
ncbi:Rieske 2Fe-2S domain-containing protein [Ideonella sp. 4Y16]|uniref:Rieske 2Fe-2S domain-containing protein n=1 Tax=Ideonella alba TaxID=2824118 RepID=A0A941BA13_9BURK|nr:Rieske 2Fe-2S domain-containing protein [Ideonella alba]MBQ0929325.1 Rieske 2Fe-2S domain-containing protein [Ideonella alba]MBQ0945435.1 Rieske 2Fe-2S domain-containing protein [Ideonella alba]